MLPPRFLIGRGKDGSELWASIDPDAHHLEAAIAERRFGAYLRPFRDEQSARDALIAAGAALIEPEAGPKRRVANSKAGGDE